MKPKIIKVLLIISVAYLLTMYFLGKNSNKILGVKEATILTPTLIPSATLEPTATPTPTSAPTIIPTKKPSPTPEPTPKPTMASSSEVNSFIERFSAQYGVDPNVLRHIAICESGFRSNAKNGPYVGLFQFGVITWKNIRKEIGEDINPDLRYSGEESIQTAAYALSKGKGGIWPNCNP